MNLEKIKFHLRRMPGLKKFLKKAMGIDRANQRHAELERKVVYGYLLGFEERLRALEDAAGRKSLRILDLGESRPSSFGQLTSQMATMDQMTSPEYAEWCGRILDTPHFHRKQWEYIYILKALDQHGLLAPGRTGLGFGVGKDAFVAYMVKQGCKVVATDLDPQAAHDKGWAQSNQYSEKLLNLNERGICSDSALREQVQFRHVDMNAIPADLRQGQFDFTWSACAFEHLGSIQKGLDFIVNQMECLKPGGVAVHTTELNLSSLDETLDNAWTVIFRKRDIEGLAERLRGLGYQIDLNFWVGRQPMDQFYDVPPYSEFNHLKLLLEKHITTSYGLIIRKPEAQ